MRARTCALPPTPPHNHPTPPLHHPCIPLQGIDSMKLLEGSDVLAGNVLAGASRQGQRWVVSWG